MTTLPSFVELMASLGINATAGQPEQDGHLSSSSSPSSSPKLLGVAAPSLRSKSSPSLRDQRYRSRPARYSPYSFTFTSSRRRGSVSSHSSSSSSDMDDMSSRSGSCSPTLQPSPRLRKRAPNKLAVNVFGSSPDLSANTPISSYVRRKTPGTSPLLPSFPRESDDSREFSKPFIIPALPSFLPPSAPSEPFSFSSRSGLEDSSSPPSSKFGLEPFPERELDTMSRSSRLHTGIRISTTPKITDVNKEIHYRVVHVA
ncbi:hypothetical protein J3R30DRAFT_3709761 [Lentinula aciculospora]|uniref:Uncharacterized protein n=1 Tax=Lentinula aciculospora TaxID=153920 RepID=A0A9W9A1F5_9AGAR|nr:hypothetical protein J3R30DRAFT_3709761 [Lentinula aciculospora]